MTAIPIQPMTLGNVRANGVRSLRVYCQACHSETVLDVDAHPDDVPVPAFSPRMVCSACGMIGADARPNWGTRDSNAEASPLMSGQWQAPVSKRCL
jgi:hypothetical protein